MTNKKQRYREFCESEPTVPLFSRAWWLDAVAGSEQWDVALAEGPDSIRAALPYVVRRRLGRVVLGMPDLLTQTLGPWVDRLGAEPMLLEQLIECLPPHSQYRQAWHFHQTNWLPFHWHGFEQTTRYTYRLDTSQPIETLWENLGSNVRGHIRKAEKRFGLQIKSDGTIDDIWNIVACSFTRQNQAMPYPLDLVQRIDAACESRDSRRIFMAYDSDGRPHAGAYLVWDDQTAYYLMGGGDPDLRQSGAGSLCMWHAIQFASQIKRTFDFEGSMIKPIERYFRDFGGVQTPYFVVSRTTSRLLAIVDGLQRIRQQYRGAVR